MTFIFSLITCSSKDFVFPLITSAEAFPKPTEKDRCPVCGMFPYKYPHWMAGYVFKDGTKVFHCSPKCFFHNLAHIGKYQPGEKREDLKLIWVTDYYTAKPIKADNPDVYYVAGTSLLGPMGWDVVPVKGRKSAEVLKKDYEGTEILKLDEVKEEHIERARKGKGKT